MTSRAPVYFVRSLVLAALFQFVPVALAATYYVSGTGNDANTGLSTTAAFRTIQHAADLTNPGDIVEAMNGTYASVAISRSGNASGPITYEAYQGSQPTITLASSDNNGINISANYIVFDGFTVQGWANNLTLSQAQSIAAANINDPSLNENCVNITSGNHKMPAALPPASMAICSICSP